MEAERGRTARGGAGTAYLTFFLSGICAMSSGIIVSLLRDRNGFSYGDVGMLLSCMNIGNMLSAFLAGILPGRLGLKRTVLLLGAGYTLGYLLCGATGLLAVTALGFGLIGMAKGAVLNTDTVLVGKHAPDRKKGMQVMHACYATGALLCPFLVSFLSEGGSLAPVLGTAAAGLVLWGVYALAPLDGRTGAPREKKKTGKRPFLREPVFWLMTLLLFCQNGAENGVTGWLVTYYKNRGILSGTLAAYTMTILWSATLAGRLTIAFALRIQRTMRALCLMGLVCSVLYFFLVGTDRALPAVILLFLFALAMAGVNPMITSGLGETLSSESMGVMLPAGALGGILMPLVIGAVSERAGLKAGMLCNLVPCLGIAAVSGYLLCREGKGKRLTEGSGR